jgi:cytidylate kinase
MKTFQDLQEGLQDPNIFKAFFLAGGPGSGKSFVVRKTTGGTGLRIVNSDDIFEKYLKDAGLEMDMRTTRAEREREERDKLRDRAKTITKKKRDNYVEGRLGLVIDGTGKDYDKIAKQSTELKQLGYDTHMIFVNTTLDVALARNAERERSVPDSVATKSWNQVQNNLGKFSQHFRGNLVIIDNNEVKEDDGTIFNKVFKQIRQLVRKKVNNPKAKEWIENEMKLRGITKAPSGRNVGRFGGQPGAKPKGGLPGSAGFKVKMGRKRPKTGRYAKK